MRKIILLSLLLLLSACWAVAQNDNSVSRKMTVEGCLDGGPTGEYTLTDPAGASYQLTGNVDQLKAHIGETLRVTGVVQSILNVPGAMSEGTETQPTLKVVAFQRVSEVCGDTNNIP